MKIGAKMLFDFGIVSSWVAFLLSLVSLLGVARSHFASGTKENTEAIGNLSDKHEKLDKRVQRIENEIKHLPTKDDFNKLSVSFAEIRGDMKAMTKSVEATERSTRRIENFLDQMGKK